MIETVAGEFDADNFDTNLSDAIRAQQPIFLSRRRTDILKLREALGILDFPTLQRVGHNCKGTGAAYGFPEISLVGSSLEQAAKACDVALVATLIDRLERSVKAAYDFIS